LTPRCPPTRPCGPARFTYIIDAEFERTRSLLADLFDGEMFVRRPRMAKTLDIREAPLKVLHHRQIVLLRKWRELLSAGRQHDADALLPDLLLSINANANASGLRTTS
jgi:phosphoenolpyruvate carboxylase